MKVGTFEKISYALHRLHLDRFQTVLIDLFPNVVAEMVSQYDDVEDVQMTDEDIKQKYEELMKRIENEKK